MRLMDKNTLENYRKELLEEEKALATIEKYLRDIRKFDTFLGEDKRVSKERVLEYKEWLKQSCKPSSINSMLVALNRYFAYLGWTECRVKCIKLQRPLFMDDEKMLSKEEYDKLIQTAREKKKEKLALIMETIASSGIRVSELEMITVEAVKKGIVEVGCKGKIRLVALVEDLRKHLLSYCREQGIQEGCVFLTRNGNPINRSYIWKQMKWLGEQAGISLKKLFPHNLRHFFARTYWKIKKDICYLADILGHSSINTTRIYTATSREEHAQILEEMGLVVPYKEEEMWK